MKEKKTENLQEEMQQHFPKEREVKIKVQMKLISLSSSSVTVRWLSSSLYTGFEGGGQIQRRSEVEVWSRRWGR
jgi:hypothetical protein